jgi:hypothetical protein
LPHIAAKPDIRSAGVTCECEAATALRSTR